MRTCRPGRADGSWRLSLFCCCELGSTLLVRCGCKGLDELISIVACMDAMCGKPPALQIQHCVSSWEGFRTCPRNCGRKCRRSGCASIDHQAGLQKSMLAGIIAVCACCICMYWSTLPHRADAHPMLARSAARRAPLIVMMSDVSRKKVRRDKDMAKGQRRDKDMGRDD